MSFAAGTASGACAVAIPGPHLECLTCGIGRLQCNASRSKQLAGRQVEGGHEIRSGARMLAAAGRGALCLQARPRFAQQDWPNRPVQVVVPFGAGGAADRLGRIAADHLSQGFKQQFYIENRVGAGGAVASTEVAARRRRRLHAADRRLRPAHHGAGGKSQHRLRPGRRFHPHRHDRRRELRAVRAGDPRREDRSRS